MLELAKLALRASQCTLAVAKDGVVETFYSRGVADLLQLHDTEPERLCGASVADKIIGKAAASILILSGVKEAYAPRITEGALRLLSEHGVKAECDVAIDRVENRTHTGRCPLDTVCAELSEPQEMLKTVRDKIRQLNSTTILQ